MMEGVFRDYRDHIMDQLISQGLVDETDRPKLQAIFQQADQRVSMSKPKPKTKPNSKSNTTSKPT